MKNTISFENSIDLYNWIVTAREVITTEDDTNKTWVQRFKDTNISRWEYQYVKDITNNPDIDYPLRYTIHDLDNADQNYTNGKFNYYNNSNEDIIIHIYLDDKAEWTPDIKPINIQFRDNIPFSDITPINVIIIPKNSFTLNIPNGDNTIETLYKLKRFYTDLFSDMILIDKQEEIFAVDILAETLTNIFLHGNIIDYDIDKIYEYKIKELEKEEITEEFYNYKKHFKKYIFINVYSSSTIEEMENYIRSEYLNTITDFVSYINNIIDSIQNKYYTNYDVNKIKYLYLDYLDQYKYKYFNAHVKVLKLLESKKDEKEKVDGDKNVSVSV